MPNLRGTNGRRQSHWIRSGRPSFGRFVNPVLRGLGQAWRVASGGGTTAEAVAAGAANVAAGLIAEGVRHVGRLGADDDSGAYSSRLSVTQVVENLEYEFHPKGKRFTQWFKDPRPLLHQLANPLSQTFATAAATSHVASASDQAVYAACTIGLTDDYEKIYKLAFAHAGAPYATGTVGGPGGLAPQLVVTNVSTIQTYENSALKIYKYNSRTHLRNRTNSTARLCIEEWLCVKDAFAGQTPLNLMGVFYSGTEDNNATVDTAVANVMWRTGGATTCRVASIVDPNERIRGHTVNTFWKRVKSTKLILAPGRTVHYTMSQQPLSITPTVVAGWYNAGVVYPAGLARFLMVYQIGMLGTSTIPGDGDKIAPVDTFLTCKNDAFAAYAGVINNTKRRDVTYLTAEGGLWKDIAFEDQRYVNTDTEIGQETAEV